MRRVSLFVGFSSVLFLLAGPRAFGDGAFIWRNEKADIFQPEQKALIEWDGQQEKLTVQTRYEGPAEEMVWVVPVPSKPEVRKGELSVLEEMSRRTQEPQVRYTPFHQAKVEASVEALVSRAQIGVYDVAVLTPEGEHGVVEWLAANGFSLQPEQEKVVSDYISRQWWIVASRIHPDALNAVVENDLAKGVIHPLEISFSTTRCVYPMYMTSLARGNVEVLLWIKGPCHYEPETLTGSDWQVEFFGGPVDGLTHDYENMWKPRAVTWHVEPWIVTKLRRVFEASKIAEDLYFREADHVAYFDASVPARVAMVASQLGWWKDPRGVDLLTDYLTQTEAVDVPHIRSAVWALGEIGSAHGLSEETLDRLETLSRNPAFGLRMESFLALHKAKSPRLRGLIAIRLGALSREERKKSDHNVDYDVQFEREQLALWVGSHREDLSGPLKRGHFPSGRRGR